MIRVLITDDHPVVRRGLTQLLQTASDISVVGLATCAGEGVEMARDLRPDVVMMDMSMPDMNGDEATAQIVSERPEARILVLTAFSDRASIERALNHGAVGALLKDATPAELIAAVRAAAAAG